MPKLFAGTLQPGQYKDWSTIMWNRDAFVEWSVRPAPGSIGPVSLRAIAVEAAEDESLTYILTVWNVGTEACEFEVWYNATQVVANPDQTFSIGPGQTMNFSWGMESEFGLLSYPPVPVSIVVRPLAPSATAPPLECSGATVQWQSQDYTVYTFSVTYHAQKLYTTPGHEPPAAVEFYPVAIFFLI